MHGPEGTRSTQFDPVIQVGLHGKCIIFPPRNRGITVGGSQLSTFYKVYFQSLNELRVTIYWGKAIALLARLYKLRLWSAFTVHHSILNFCRTEWVFFISKIFLPCNGKEGQKMGCGHSASHIILPLFAYSFYAGQRPNSSELILPTLLSHFTLGQRPNSLELISSICPYYFALPSFIHWIYPDKRAWVDALTNS